MTTGSLVLIVVVGTSIWVAIDAGDRDWTTSRWAGGPLGWLFGCLVVWILFFPGYLVQRGKVPKKSYGPNMPPGWYPDPGIPGAVRWWDGWQWTSAVQRPGPPQGPPVIRP